MAATNKRFMLLLALNIIAKRRRRRRYNNSSTKELRKYWVRPLFRQREELGSFNILFKQMRQNDREQFFRYSRMSPESLDYLSHLVAPYIKKSKTKFRDPISPVVRLAITLRYLASGESQQSLSWSYRVGRITVSKIIRETCDVIWKVLMQRKRKLQVPQKNGI